MSDDMPINDDDADDQPEDDREDDDELAEPDEFEMPPPKRRRTLPIIAAIVLVIILVGAGLLVTHAVGGIGPSPTPTPTLLPGENLFYVTTNPAWGKISIDGHVFSHLPAVGDTPLTLSPGGHTITWNAPPFSPQQCIVYVPPQATTGGVCTANDVQPVAKGKDAGLQATVISFTASSSMLPAAQHTALYNTIQAYLTSLQSSDTVQPGEQYVDLSAPHMIAMATQPLRATLRYQLDTNPSSNAPCIASIGPGQSCQAQGGNCYAICNGQGVFGRFPALPNTIWDIYGVVRMSWDYTTLSGQSVATDQPNTADSSKPEYLVEFYASWDGARWHVTQQTQQNNSFSFPIDPIACLPMEALIQGNGVEPSYFGVAPNALTTVNVHGQAQSLIWVQYTAGTNQAAGCLGAASLTPGSPQTPVAVNASSATCLYRFGVLLAANATAHRYWPTMPIVDSYEQSIAQRLTPHS